MSMELLSRGLAGLKVVDLGRGLAGGVAAKLLADLGAEVIRFTPARDPFSDIYPAYKVWHARASVVVATTPEAPEVAAALAKADLCIVGGEDHPDHAWSVEAQALAHRHPHLVVLDLQAYPQDGAGAGRPAVEVLVQARSGLAWEQFSKRPVRLSFEAGGYGAALHGLTAALGAVCQRERSGGAGQLVRSSLYEGALTLAVQSWYRASQPSGAYHVKMPIDPYPLIFKCRDGRYIHFVLGSFGSKGRLYRILKIDDPSVGPDDSGVPTGRGDPKTFYGDVDVLAAHVINFDSEDLVAQIRAAEIAVNFVLAPGECWDDVQVAHSGVLTRDEAGGRHVGLPMRGALAPLDPGARLEVAAGAEAAPLAGIRAVDFGIFVAGPYGASCLVDLGADVIKVETPAGDPNRNIFRSFAGTNRGKRAIALDMKTADGMAIAARLTASAQILHNNFRPGVSARLGVDPATQHAADPGKIILECTGYGRTGPYGDRAGFDMIFQAFCGHEVRAGGVGGTPMWHRSAMIDYFLGLLNAVATLVATWRRLRGAGGADLELSLLDAGLLLFSEMVETPEGRFEGAPPLNPAQTGFHPAEALYACADGWIGVAARGETMAAALGATLGFQAGPARGWGDEEGAKIAGGLSSLTAAEALARLEAAGVWAEPCVQGGETTLAAPDDAPGLTLRSLHPVYGELDQIGPLFRLGDGRPRLARGVPALGGDTREILTELGYSAGEIEDFYARKIVA